LALLGLLTALLTALLTTALNAGGFRILASNPSGNGGR
jgi:hypothetical protein